MKHTAINFICTVYFPRDMTKINSIPVYIQSYCGKQNASLRTMSSPLVLQQFLL